MSIVKKILNLQVYGSYRLKNEKRYGRDRGNHVMDNLLPRLAFKLSDLLRHNILFEEGHVFLGFTKDGQFVLSYTLVDNPNMDHNHLFKYDTYTLHFWLFAPSRSLKKIGEVQLFGSELTLDLESNGLRIATCQWPSEHNKILVYGCNRDQWSQPCNEEVECFITIAAIPPIRYCEKCCRKKETLNSQNNSKNSSKKWIRCLEHSFVVHLQYHLLPPFPPFIPKMCLNLEDGTVIFNTGDAIHALSISVMNNAINGYVSNKNLSKPTDSESHFPSNNLLNSSLKVNNNLASNTDLEDRHSINSGNLNVGIESKENIKPEQGAEFKNDRTKFENTFQNISSIDIVDYELIYVQQEDVENEDDFNHFDDDVIYNNHLSLEVCSSYNTRMKVLPKSKLSSWHKECICVKHQICQVESFVNGMVNKICSSMFLNKTMIFVDYYTQILDICPVSSSVFIIIQLLFESKENLAKKLSFSWYKCSYFFQWRPSSGKCSLLHQSSFQEIDSQEKERIKRNGPLWDPENLTAQTRHLQSLRPSPSYMQSVKVLTNEAVLKNESLKIICEPYHGVALVL